jgi:hypothetical protein
MRCDGSHEDRKYSDLTVLLLFTVRDLTSHYKPTDHIKLGHFWFGTLVIQLYLWNIMNVIQWEEEGRNLQQ